MEKKLNKLNKFKFNSESFERYKTDLSEYSFMLEQEYKKKVIPQQFKKNKIWYNNLVINIEEVK